LKILVSKLLKEFKVFPQVHALTPSAIGISSAFSKVLVVQLH
jgi:hypothetical protein